jgi:hypothetical protein
MSQASTASFQQTVSVVIGFERSQADFVFYSCNRNDQWKWHDSFTGKSSHEHFASRQAASDSAMSFLGRS